jgi:hypothetical protein
MAVGVVCDLWQSGTEAGFSLSASFSLPVLHNRVSSGAGTMGPFQTTVARDLISAFAGSTKYHAVRDILQVKQLAVFTVQTVQSVNRQ